MCQKCNFKLNNHVLWKSKNEWLLTSKSNYFAEHIDMSQVEKLGPDYYVALGAAAWKYSNDVVVFSGNTPQV